VLAIAGSKQLLCRQWYDSVISGKSTVAVRISPDDMRLDVLLTHSLQQLSSVELTDLVCRACAQVGVDVSRLEIPGALANQPVGNWLTLLSGVGPIMPSSGRVELLMSIPVFASANPMRRTRLEVRRGQELARLTPSIAGSPGRSLSGREITVPVVKGVRLPAGPNTEISADGMSLLAGCDGEVVLRNLLVEVIPMYVHEGDVTAGSGPLMKTGGLLIKGSVLEGGRVEAIGDVYIAGNVTAADIRSHTSNVSVGGTVSGWVGRLAQLRAAGHIQCDQARQAKLTANGDVYIQATACQTTILAGGTFACGARSPVASRIARS